MGKIIGIISIKGGVGKTSVASSLASDLANNFDKKVLLIDANYSAPNLGLHMDIIEPEKTIHDILSGRSRLNSAIHKKYGVDVVPGSYVFEKRINALKLKDKINKVKDNYDFVVLDSSPTLNDEILSTILASDILLMVSTPDYPTLSCSMKAAKLARQRGKPIAGIILNKIRNSKHEISTREIEVTTGIPVIARIPDEKVHISSLYYRMPLILHRKSSKFAKEISAISRTLTSKGKKSGILQSIFPLNINNEEINRQILMEKINEGKF